jgi:hypothetical protein
MLGKYPQILTIARSGPVILSIKEVRSKDNLFNPEGSENGGGELFSPAAVNFVFKQMRTICASNLNTQNKETTLINIYPTTRMSNYYDNDNKKWKFEPVNFVPNGNSVKAIRKRAAVTQKKVPVITWKVTLNKSTCVSPNVISTGMNVSQQTSHSPTHTQNQTPVDNHALYDKMFSVLYSRDSDGKERMLRQHKEMLFANSRITRVSIPISDILDN